MLYPEYPEYDNFNESGALIKVVGVGGGGGNAVNHMVMNMVKQEMKDIITDLKIVKIDMNFL